MFTELWTDLRHRLRALVRRGDVERELDDELRFHLDRESEKLERLGLPRGEAEHRARLAFGGVSRVKDDSRDTRGVARVEQLAQDVRYALRGMRARPLFTGVIVATLAIGVGVNAAMFGVLDRTFLRPPARLIDPASVNRVFVDWTGSDGTRGAQVNVAYPQYADIARWSRSISQIAVFSEIGLAVGDGDQTRDLQVAQTGPGYFDFFDAHPAVGRFFDSTEMAPPTEAHVAILSYGYWESQYGGSRAVIGSGLTVANSRYRIIGVAPKGFDGVSDGRTPVVFIPLAARASEVDRQFATDYGWTSFMLIVRRKPGVTVADASADLTNAFRRSWETYRAAEPSVAPAAVVRPEAIAAPVQIARGPTAAAESRVMLWIGGVALIVLLIACANVANLLLARALRRKREIAVRRAIGGTRGRLVQQLLTETFMLALLGSMVGIAAAQFVARGLAALLEAEPGNFNVAGDGRTLVFAALLVVLITVFAGLVPALHSEGDGLADALRAGTREGGYRRSRARTTLLVSQIALSVVMLVGAGLFVRSLGNVHDIRLGYDANHLVYAQVNERGAKLTLPEKIQLEQRLEAATHEMPGVSGITPMVSVPLWAMEGRKVYVAGIDSVRKLGRFGLQGGSLQFFSTLGTRILRGRGISPLDRANTPYVAVVSEAMAKAVWKSDNPLGKCFRIGADTNPCTTVVGVAENVHNYNLVGADEFTYYLPIEQYYREFGSPMMTSLFVRVNGRPDDYVEAMRSRLQKLMPGPAYVEVRAVHELVDPRMRSWTSGARMFSGFGALALVLAAIGLYAVIAFAVAGRTQELGVRIALGARRAHLLQLVLGEGVRVTLVGAAIGIAVAALGGRALDPLLFHESARDPWVYAAVAATLIAVGLVASTIPALRATRVDPNVALRAE
ncbi:MAG TPA: ADOP family duplicated permease [Gemmatimonadaceae bacterium]|nr:ADOP family duplicated permease [Gemmatimonadaceae bacterium]